MGQSCIGDRTIQEEKQFQKANTSINNADIVKAKLKHTRDRITQLMSRKQSDRSQIDIKISEKLPQYQRTKNKKIMVPLLQSKKSLNEFIQSAEVRLQLINDKIAEVEMQQMNIDVKICQNRPLIFSKTLISTQEALRMIYRKGIGEEFWKKLKKNIKWTGIFQEAKISKMMPSFKKCGDKQEEISQTNKIMCAFKYLIDTKKVLKYKQEFSKLESCITNEITSKLFETNIDYKNNIRILKQIQTIMNYSSIDQIERRVIKIIHKFFDQEFRKKSYEEEYGLEEGRIEEWCDMLYQMIIPKQTLIKPLTVQEKSSKMNSHSKIEKKNKKNGKFPHPQSQPFSYIIDLNNKEQNYDTLKIYSSQLLNLSQQGYQFNSYPIPLKENPPIPIFQYELNYPKNTFFKYSSVCPLLNNSYIVSGGINNKKKSNLVYLMDLFNQQSELKPTLTAIARLIEPVSSHSSVYIEPYIYFVGGKKQEGAITKQCSKIRFNSQYKNGLLQAEEIAALNYASASFCLTVWKNSYIYKIGGVGESFDSTDVSPFIQRYDIETDCWELINPIMSDPLSSFRLAINSLAYSYEGGIIVLGGFDFYKNTTNFGFRIQISDINQLIREQFSEGLSSQGEFQKYHHHMIKNLWNEDEMMQVGGFDNGQYMIIEKEQKKYLGFLHSNLTLKQIKGRSRLKKKMVKEHVFKIMQLQ